MARGDVRWCAHPRLHRGEILSSWLHRYAWCNGLSGHSFARHVFGEQPVWTRDIDRSADGGLLSCASAILGEPLSRLRGATIRRYEGRAFASCTTNGWLPWLAPVGVYHRTRRHHGSAFCAQCLQERACARLHWRMAWNVHCSRHEVALQDACPRCDAPFVFHRISLAVHGRLACPVCGHNFANYVRSAPVPMRARALQLALTAACQRGCRVLDGETISALEYVGGIRWLLGGLYGKSTWCGIADALPPRLRGGVPCRAPSRLPFEYWRIHERAKALALLATAVEDWPARLLAACRRGPVYQARFGRLERAPDWVVRTLAQVR
ncbi:TniQ family protein [Thermomonas fusca]|uniref:TniQ domain-containing protein n=1 Tax=Thermomonas fusca TaxID=215690 RepID=A0A5R9PG30_9GAMM|nr:hypothetical protein E5S66_00155 [Thermomonas fusca]